MVIKDKAFERRTETIIFAFLFFRVGRRTKFKNSNKGCRTSSNPGWGKQPAGIHRHSTSGYKRCSKSGGGAASWDSTGTTHQDTRDAASQDGWGAGGAASWDSTGTAHQDTRDAASQDGWGGGGGRGKQPVGIPQAQHIRIQEMQQVRMGAGGKGEAASWDSTGTAHQDTRDAAS